MKACPQIVLDTNVLVAGLRSRNGASFELLRRLPTGQYRLHLTVPLAMEYEDVLHRSGLLPLPVDAIDAVLDMVCAVAVQQPVHFLWRPQLRDPRDELVLEAVVNASADYLVTHNLRDYQAAWQNGGQTPAYVRQFADWLAGRVASGDVPALLDYRRQAPDAVRAHPSEEHLLPFFIALGAAGSTARAERFHRGIDDYVIAMDAYAFLPR